MYQLFCIENGTQTDVTPLVGTITWRSNEMEISQQLDFDIAFNDDRYFPINPIKLGSMMILKNEEEILRAIVVSEERAGRGKISYTCFDHGFYLNKSSAVYQFNKMNAKSAIEKILEDFKIPVGNIPSMVGSIRKIYNGQSISEILKGILKQENDSTKKHYRMEMRQGKFYVQEEDKNPIEGTFKLSENIQPYDISTSISNPVRKRSIEEMRNKVQVVVDKKILAQQQKQDLIDQYGMLSHIESVDHHNKSKAQILAKKRLKDLGKIFEENSVEMLGDDRVRAGRCIKIQEPITGMSGIYRIKDACHTLENNIHKMQLGLEVMEWTQ